MLPPWRGSGAGSRVAAVSCGHPVTAIVVSGPPAAGKTTLATALARRLGYAVADLDTVTGPLTRAAFGLLGMAEDAVDGAAGRQLRAARYETLLDVAAANLGIGIGVVITAPFTRERSTAGGWHAVTTRLGAASQGGPVALVYLASPAGVRRARMTSRGAARDARKHGSPDRPAQNIPPPAGTIVVNGTQPVNEQVEATLTGLRRTASLKLPQVSAPSGLPSCWSPC
jgi:predicted kinase